MGGVYLAWFEKGHMVWMLNDWHTPFTDSFFLFVTYLGDGGVICALSLLLVFVQYRIAIACANSYLLSGIPVRIFKDWLMAGWPRPKLFYNMDERLLGVEGVEIHLYNSFPSGHTATAFAFFLVLSLYSHKVNLQITCFFLALCVGISRVFLAQHFFEDVYAGSICGVVGGYLSYFVIQKYGKPSWDKRLTLKF
ncbi:MAG: phosphatase PAP2 family protein [Cytophagales bacterium]|nr:phosphatase PAP2 family protein [Cytophagales bacterium]MDW8385304.1 phosphatase PAP2 family protein [Flammeovirgaceae bacterium]